MSGTESHGNCPVDNQRTSLIVDETILRSSQLATLPAVATRIIHLCENPDCTTEHLASAIDTVLAVRLLKLVNSAFYGLSRHVDSIPQALNLLGLKAVKNVAVAISLVKMIRGGRISPEFDAADLWTHSIAVATGARLLAKKSGLVSIDESFLAGLIHDMGIVVELQACAPNFAKVIQKLTSDDELTFVVLKKRFWASLTKPSVLDYAELGNFRKTSNLRRGFTIVPGSCRSKIDVCLLSSISRTSWLLMRNWVIHELSKHIPLIRLPSVR